MLHRETQKHCFFTSEGYFASITCPISRIGKKASKIHDKVFNSLTLAVDVSMHKGYLKLISNNISEN